MSTQLATQQRLNRELAATRVKLAQVERLAELRGGVLTRSRQAVEQVEPLLSSVDSLPATHRADPDEPRPLRTLYRRRRRLADRVLERGARGQQSGDPLDAA